MSIFKKNVFIYWALLPLSLRTSQVAQWSRICLSCRRRRRCRFSPRVEKILWRRAWQPTAVFLPGESHGQRSLVAAVRGWAWMKHLSTIAHLFLNALGLCCRAGSSLGARTSFSLQWLLLLWNRGSGCPGFSSCGSRASLLRCTCDLPRPGTEPVSPALPGRFFATETPGKPDVSIFNWSLYVMTTFSSSGKDESCGSVLNGRRMRALENQPLHLTWSVDVRFTQISWISQSLSNSCDLTLQLILPLMRSLPP